MPIKTLHITNAYHQNSGGISTFYRALLDAANQEGRLMRLVVPGAETKIEEFGAYGRIYHVRAPHTPFFDRRYRLLLPPTYLPFSRGAVLDILREEQPDLVEICDKYSVSWLAGLVRRHWLPRLPRPVLVGMSCERMDDNVAAFLTQGAAGRRWSQMFLGSFYIPLFDYHLANSEYTAAELRSAMKPQHQRPVHVLPMGANIDEFAAARANEATRRELLNQAGGHEQTQLLLYAGRLSPEKNLPLLIALMERLAQDKVNDYRLVVAGAGPLAEWFDVEARRCAPGRVLFLGHVRDRQALINLYANCDLFVHPNPREPFGIAPLEAMAAGLPLVAPRQGGVLAYANDNNAWLAEADAASFAEAVRAVGGDPALRKDKLARARWIAAQHAWPTVATQFFKLYDQLHAEFPTSRFAPQLAPHGPELARKIAHEEL
jgi:alpha-1,6-mannosyltransferase